MKIFTVFFTLFISLGLVFAQGDAFNFSGNGARSAGMGYAFTGVADDATAISWNSAGMTQLYSPEASVVGRVSFNSGELKNFENKLIDGVIYDAYDIEYGSNFQLNFASIIFPFEISGNKVVGGVSFRNQYDFFLDRMDTYKISGFEYEAEDVVEGGINTISPSVAVEINEILSIGAAVNILTGSEEGEGFDDGIANSEYSSDDYSFDYSGVAFDIGILVKPSNMFSIGANLNLPHTLTLDGTFPVFNPVTREFLGSFDGEFDLDVPFFFSVGAAVHATDNFLLAFDYQSRNWSNAELDGEEFFTEDLNSIHVGLEYLLQSGTAIIPLRAGFYTNPLFILDNDGDQVSTNVITLGTGLVLGNIIVDASYEFSGLDYELVNDVTLEQTFNRLTLGATVHFGK